MIPRIKISTRRSRPGAISYTSPLQLVKSHKITSTRSSIYLKFNIKRKTSILKDGSQKMSIWAISPLETGIKVKKFLFLSNWVLDLLSNPLLAKILGWNPHLTTMITWISLRAQQLSLIKQKTNDLTDNFKTTRLKSIQMGCKCSFLSQMGNSEVSNSKALKNGSYPKIEAKLRRVKLKVSQSYRFNFRRK